MARRFRIHYNTSYNERMTIQIKESLEGSLTSYDMSNVGGMHSYTDEKLNEIWYRYVLVRDDGVIEEKHFRHLCASDDVLMIDTWRSPENPSDVLKAKSFAEAVFGVGENLQPVEHPQNNHIAIRLCDSRLGKNEAFCVVSKQFINWNTDHAMVMKQYDDFVWQLELNNDVLLKDIEFKFGIWDTEKDCFKCFEEGENRSIVVGPYTQAIIVTYDGFNYSRQWRAAGVAVPVFSLRTKKSRGCGEFSDISALADWCQVAGLKVIQLLPINDTTAAFNFKDSYPYNAISVMALHPSYVSVDEVYAYYGVRMKSMDRETAMFINDLNMVDYDRTREWKKHTMKSLLFEKFDEIVSEAPFVEYLEKNAWWVKNYASFAYLRDKYRTPDFRQWETCSYYKKDIVDNFFTPGNEAYREVMFRVFIQYHLEKQLNKALAHCHELGIAVKGDLPIGINPNSVEAWVEPELFNFGLQAGAPPDFFSRDGQNWGFPIYNWGKMAENGFEWWERRMGRMQQFFDVFRIDHILGFFRIWSIPHPFKSGLMGIFSPALPFSEEELRQRGFNHDPHDFSRPVVSKEYLVQQLGEYADQVDAEMFEDFQGLRRLKKIYFDPRATEPWIEAHVAKTMSRERIRQGLANIMHEVLFVSVIEGEWHPRIMLDQTNRFNMLSNEDKGAIKSIHDDFFYNRHNEFWKECAETNLHGMLSKCNMLVCGEDLGMIPSSVPVVMKRMQILALELQRMPKLNWERYGNCSGYDYMSVCATSSHDISTIRGWWEENFDETQWYYSNVLRHSGSAPRVATGELVMEVLDIHMKSPSMLCINPIQDYAGTVDNMPHLYPHEERINQPANPNHYWRYRMPFCIDEAAEKYPKMHENVRKMVNESGR